MDDEKTCVSINLTEKRIENATRLKNGGQKLYFDTDLKGFGLCVGKKTKTFFVQRYIKKEGRAVRVSIGRSDVYTLKNARDEGRDLLARMGKGENPNKTKKSKESQGITLKEGFDLYINTLKTKHRSEKTIKGYEYAINTYLSDWLTRPLIDITRKDAHTRHKKIAKDVASGKYATVVTKNNKKYKKSRNSENGKYTANAAMGVFRATYNRAMKQNEELPPNPCINIDWFPTKRREAAIKSDDLNVWYNEIMKMDNTIRRDYLRLVLFTGLRRQSAAEVQWTHVDFDRHKLHIPNPKGGKPFDLPLSNFLIKLLKSRKKENSQIYPDSPWVFPANSKSGHISEPKIKLSIPWTVHGLRNTFITIADSLNISTYKIKLLVNHTLPTSDITAGYVQHQVDEIREPMQQITNKLLKLCESR